MQNKPPNGETLLQSREAALEALQRIAGQPGLTVEGPAAVAQQKDLLTHSAVRDVARAYLAAFQEEVKRMSDADDEQEIIRQAMRLNWVTFKSYSRAYLRFSD